MLRFLLVALAAYLLIVALAYVGQRKLQYFPDRRAIGPVAAGLDSDVAEVVIDTPDGERVAMWYRPAPEGAPTILFLHGNGGAIHHRTQRFRAYQAAGFGVAFLSYRGYGASTGSPSERGLVSDALAAYDHLAGSGAAPERLAVIGESLGSAVAVRLAVERPVGALVLEAPFTSAVAVGAAAYPWLPVRLLMWDRYDTASIIARVQAPLLVIHGERDTIVPIEQGRALFAAAPEPKTFLAINGAGHNDLASADVLARETAFVAETLQPRIPERTGPEE